MLQILERLQGEIEEVPRAAGRVEHREHAQPVEERPIPPLGRVQPFRAGGRRFGGFHSIQGAGDLGLRRVPLGQPRADHHRLNEQHDLVAVGVVRAELRAFTRVEPALEQRAEDRRIDLRPVEVRRRQYRLDVSGLQRERRTIVE